MTLMPLLGAADSERASMKTAIDPDAQAAWNKLSTWTFQNLDGKPMAFSQLRGKALIVDLWATWCAPCLIQLPAIQRLHARYQTSDRVAVVTLNVDQDVTKAAAHLKKQGYSFPAYKAFTEVDEAFGGQIRLPRTWVVDASGKLVAEVRDDSDDAAFERKMEQMLNDLPHK